MPKFEKSSGFKMKGFPKIESPIKRYTNKSYETAWNESAKTREKYGTKEKFIEAAKAYHAKKQKQHQVETSKKRTNIKKQTVSLKPKTVTTVSKVSIPKVEKVEVPKKVIKKQEKITRLETKKQTRESKGKGTERITKRINRKKVNLENIINKLFKKK